MILEENKVYTSKQLAEWFGLSYGAFRNNKGKKLEELKAFADYEIIGKKFKINKVYNSTYSKNGTKVYETVKRKTLEYWNENGLDTSKNVAKKMYQEEPQIRDLIKPATAYNYVIKSKTEMFGVPYDQRGGELGICWYEWSKQGPDGNPIPFNDKENKIKEEVIQKYYGNITEQGLMLMGEYKAGRIKGEDTLKQLDAILTASGEVNEMNSEQKFFAFLQELTQKINNPVVKATRVIKLKPEEGKHNERLGFNAKMDD